MRHDQWKQTKYRRHYWLLPVLMVLTAVRAAALPEEFPAVALIAESEPRYTVLVLDDWDETTAYLLFDGNVEQGYNRLYVWVPDHATYGTPVAMRADEDGSFSPLQRRVENDENEYSEIAWNIRWRHHLSAGSTTDYLTGEMIERERRRYVRFWFSINLERGSSDRPADSLRLTIPGYLDTTAEWIDVKEIRPERRDPWNHLRVMVDIDRQVEQDRILLRMTANLWHRHHTRQVSIERLPEQFFNVGLSVFPYLQDPVYDEDLPLRTLVHDGVMHTVEPRWYSIVWEYEFHPWLGGAAHEHSHFMPVARIQ